MNKLQIVQRVFRESGKAGSVPATLSSPGQVVARMIDWVDDAWASLQLEPYNWKWRRQTVTGLTAAGRMRHTAADLGIASFSSWRRPDRNYWLRAQDPANPSGGWWPLSWRDYDRFMLEIEDVGPPPGQPSVWSVSPARELMIGPAGDKAYSVRGDIVRAPTVLEDDTDVPDMPADFHMILVWRALIESGKRDVSAETVNRAADSHNDLLDKLIVAEGEPITMGNLPLA